MNRNPERTRDEKVRNASGSVVENLEGRRMLAGVYELGININDGWSDTMRKGVPVMKDLGVKTARVWVGPNFANPQWEGALTRAVDLASKGFDIMLIVNPEGGKMPAASDVKKWFSWAVGNSSLRNAVDRWQVGNEVDQSYYWRGTNSQYVNNFLKPAYEALHARGEKVVSGSVSWNPDDVKDLINEGMLKYADMVGYHPYADSISQLKSRVQQIKNIVGGRKPIVASEWNVRKLEHNKTQWAAAVKEAFPIIRDNFAYNYYFALLNTTKGKAGPAGIMNSDGSRQTLFYNALKAGMNGGGGSGSTGSDTGSNSGSGSTGGSTSSALPSIAKISVYSGNGTKLVDSLTNGATIDLSNYSSSELQFVATTGSGTSSVKFTIGSKSVTENEAPYQWDNFNASAGSYTLNVTPYSKDNLSGTKGSTRTFSFKVVKSSSTGSTGGSNSGSGKGSISGILWNDSDYDGQIDSSELRVGGRKVFIDSNRNGRLDSGEKSTTSDSKGNYRFDNLSAGEYAVSRVYPSGYAMSNDSRGYVTTTVAAGKESSGVHVGTIRKSSSAYKAGFKGSSSGNTSSSSITGTVKGTLFNDSDRDGKLDSNESFNGVRTVYIDSNRNGRLDSGERSTQTDSKGRFSFSNVAVGTQYISRVFPKGFKMSNNSKGFLTISVNAGQTVDDVNIGSTYA